MNKKLTKTQLATLKNEDAKKRNAYNVRISNTDNFNEKFVAFFEDVKSADAWTDEQKTNIARYLAHKYFKNKFSWSGLILFDNIAKVPLLSDYTNYNSFKNMNTNHDYFLDAYDAFAIIYDAIPAGYNWSKLFADDKTETIERVTRHTFVLGSCPQVKSVDVSLIQKIYKSLDDAFSRFRLETSADKYLEEKEIDTFENTLIAYESKNVGGVYSSIYYSFKGKTIVADIDFDDDTRVALETIARRCNMTDNEILSLFFVSACDCSLSRVSACIKAYSGTEYSTTRIRKFLDSATKKIQSMHNRIEYLTEKRTERADVVTIEELMIADNVYKKIPHKTIGITAREK